jgi:hypothetical protein
MAAGAAAAVVPAVTPAVAACTPAVAAPVVPAALMMMVVRVTGTRWSARLVVAVIGTGVAAEAAQSVAVPAADRPLLEGGSDRPRDDHRAQR